MPFKGSTQRAPDAAPASVQHVAVDHGRAHVFVAEELLDSADVVPVFEEVSGEGVRHRGWQLAGL